MCLLILTYVIYESGYDRFHSKSENIFRLCSASTPYMPPPMAEIIAGELPGVENYSRLIARDHWIVKYGNRKFRDDRLALVDPSFFRIFDFEFVNGNPGEALNEPYSIVITTTMAEKYFGEENPLGKIMTLRYNNDYKVTGVIEEMPDNSHIRFDAFATLLSGNGEFGENMMNHWGWNNFIIYLNLNRNIDKEEQETKCAEIIASHRQLDPDKPLPEFTLQPLRKIHLNSHHFDHDVQAQGNINNIYAFSAIGFLILLIAIINYFNLLKANSASRLKEMGLKKVAGASKQLLLKQFVFESLFIVIVSFLLSLLLVKSFLPLYNDISQVGLSMEVLGSGVVIFVIAIFLMLLSILAGLYSTYILTGNHLMDDLRPSFLNDRSKLRYRKLLIGTQFVIISIMIGCSLFMFRQVRFLNNKELGYNSDSVLMVSLPSYFMEEAGYQTLKQELLKQNFVLNVTAASRVPTDNLGNWTSFRTAGSEESISMPVVHVRYDFFETLGIDAEEGRLFSKEIGSDQENAVILNNKAVTKLGYKDGAVGQSLWCGWPESDRKIVGVLEDFHFESLYELTTPVVYILHADNSWRLLVRVTPSDIQSKINTLERICTGIYPEWIYDFRLLNDRLDEVYSSDRNRFKLMNSFTLISILIATMGLFALVMIMTRQRKKEIGIRKVNGARTKEIIKLINMEFVLLVTISFLVSCPLIYLIMDKWLDNFAYQTNLGLLVFVLTGVLSVLVALVTVNWQTLKAARINPADSLRNE
ncbi:MAG: ABC transporter permease [Bacteroidales bacterium]|nr:ABC transporter permease [Bacteroidales bacterium]